ncbi:MAG: bifunctional anthranilate synthase component II/anthranilate phosphoribosyltransferase [Spirochaetes bacterium]|nr:MAG: bifunctional anthranilate synthase component II/anthranilate phosphoribosyltransferase [Spirochaetota bacterium]
MYLIIDNYDSFTYNLYQYLSELTEKEIFVVRNDKISTAEIERMNPEGLIISPGPGRPENAGVSISVIHNFAGKVPILGVCLGHQAIGYAFGAEIRQAESIVHGKVDSIRLDGKGLFRNIPPQAGFTRYHSLVLDKTTIPEVLEITAWSSDGEIMGVRHKKYMVEGIQFHPESVASDFGKKILKNFINYKREPFNTGKILFKVISGKNCSYTEAADFMGNLTDGELSNTQIASFLTAMNMKGAVPEELAGFVSILRKKKVSIKTDFPVLDTCGTGGDGLGTFNISSLAAVAAVAAGAKVAKHGNRGVSSPSGSADFFKALGIKIELPPEKASVLLKETGFSFLFAPIYHSAMKFAAPVRRELKMKTVMNLLGPLANPAGAEYQLIGVYAEELIDTVAEAAHILGSKRVMVVHGLEGLDEISVCGPTRIVETDEKGNKKDYIFTLDNVGIKQHEIQDLKGGSAAENALIARSILFGDSKNELQINRYAAVRDAVLLNAGAALYVYGAADCIEEGYKKAFAAYREGAIGKKLKEIINISRSLALGKEVPSANIINSGRF